jgi:hypothetical protein
MNKSNRESAIEQLNIYMLKCLTVWIELHHISCFIFLLFDKSDQIDDINIQQYETSL